MNNIEVYKLVLGCGFICGCIVGGLITYIFVDYLHERWISKLVDIMHKNRGKKNV